MHFYSLDDVKIVYGIVHLISRKNIDSFLFRRNNIFRENITSRIFYFLSGDGLRVVDFETKGLLVDQTIEKVSFCAPDHNYDRGFSYICRDGTTRRWMCHGFMAIKETVNTVLQT